MNVMRDRVRPRRVIVLGGLLLLAGCSGTPSTSESPGPSGATATASSPAASVTLTATPGASATPEPTATPTPTPTSTPERSVAGEVLLVPVQRGYVDDQRASEGDDVYARGSVSTDDEGSIQFNLDEKIERCTLDVSSRVGVLPSNDWLLHFDDGSAVCLTGPQDRELRLSAGENVELRMADPGFMVTVDGDTTIIRVESGLVEVVSTDAGGSVLLGPKNRSEIVVGGSPSAAELWARGELESDLMQEAVGALENISPDLSMPDTDGSPVLQRMRDANTIVVGVPEILAADGPSLAFANGMMSNQTSHWDLGEHSTNILESQDAAEAVRSGKIDLYVSPDRIEGLGQIPFFDSPAGRRYWLQYDSEDERFGEAERNYLRDVVSDGSYRVVYISSFDQEPIYEAVAALFELD